MDEITYTAEQVEEMATKRAEQAVREVITMARANGGAPAKLSPKQQMMQRIFKGGASEQHYSNDEVRERIRKALWK